MEGLLLLAFIAFISWPLFRAEMRPKKGASGKQPTQSLRIEEAGGSRDFNRPGQTSPDSNSSLDKPGAPPPITRNPESRVPPIAIPTARDSDFEVVSDGFQPSDHCSCGGTWVKRENVVNGGRFFTCSRYPKCSNTRDQVLKKRLGARYKDFYCSRGHELSVFGTTKDFKTGLEICNRCIDKGYRKAPMKTESSTSNSDYLTNYSKELSSKTPKPPSADRCKNGHPRTAENTYVRPDGSRECRICRKEARK